MPRIASFVVAVVVCLMATLPANAQTMPEPDNSYIVQPGDTGWELSRQYYSDATIWQRIVDMNPFLQEQGRVFERGGKIVLLLKPGEELVGLERIGVQPPVAIPVTEFVASVATPIVEERARFNWLWFLLIPLVLIGIYLIVRYLPEARRPNLSWLGRYNPTLTTNPVTAVPPLVAGGIASNDHEAVRRQFREQASRTYAETHGIAPQWDNVRIVGDIVRGRLHDVWEVLDALRRWTPRRFNGEQGFQAMVSINEAEPTLLTWCQGCANDLRAGTRYRNGRFVPDTATQPIPATESTQPTVPFRPQVATEQHVGPMVTVTVGRMRYEAPADANIRINVEGGDVRVRANGEIRVTELPKRTKPRAARPSATGTGIN